MIRFHIPIYENILPTLNGIIWATYTSDKYGISFEYPSDWVVEEKTNRFESGSDVLASNGLNMFKFMNPPQADPEVIRQAGFQTIATTIANGLTKDHYIIETIDFNKYRIGGKDAGSFLYVSNVANESELPTQAFIINSDPLPIDLMYQDTKLNLILQEVRK
jgi:hypothetical protein